MRGLTTWTILPKDGPDHLGLRCNAFPEQQMALLITSNCVPSRKDEGRRAPGGIRRARTLSAGGGSQDQQPPPRPRPAFSRCISASLP